jgi:pyruvate kinase
MDSLRKTKIVATMGPASSSMEMLEKLGHEGLNVARLNFSHGTLEEHAQVIENVRAINAKNNWQIAILGDLQGPKLRVGDIENGAVELVEGQTLTITNEKIVGTSKRVYLSYQDFAKDVKPGERVLMDDGKLSFTVLKSDGKSNVDVQVIYGGTLKPNKGVNLPNTKISQPSLTPKDKADLEFILEHNLDWVALSFVRSARDIIELRHLITQQKKDTKIVAKIEKPEALKDIDDIIKETDAVMVARGDLGVEIPMEEVPLVQKSLIEKSRIAAKPVIVATQMMESMIENAMPTRAEVNDVANAVLDGADAVMLSGETSVGKYPTLVVRSMRNIINEIENSEKLYHHETAPTDVSEARFISDSICYNACRLAQRVNGKALVTMSFSGYTAFKLSSQRPKSPVFVFSGNKKLLTQLSLVWGVKCIYYDKFVSTDHTIDDIKYLLRKEGFVNTGDFLVNIASMPITERGMSNMLKLTQV